MNKQLIATKLTVEASQKFLIDGSFSETYPKEGQFAHQSDNFYMPNPHNNVEPFSVPTTQVRKCRIAEHIYDCRAQT